MAPPPPIRPARAGDAPGIVALIGRVFEEYGFVWHAATEVPDLLDAFPGPYAAPAG